ncbi:hypothetical protein AORI_1860 [Amycolatopsis keratiniphila]|uniref:Uncharacterized protein n=1 Tax=Amycolatopsis keratiniphila TaxID=129921 RepID=R4T1B1_9PSEU|nr:hypothetical protein AORI_1860 [Amycolatopsis keratiniphila]
MHVLGHQDLDHRPHLPFACVSPHEPTILSSHTRSAKWKPALDRRGGRGQGPVLCCRGNTFFGPRQHGRGGSGVNALPGILRPPATGIQCAHHPWGMVFACSPTP